MKMDDSKGASKPVKFAPEHSDLLIHWTGKDLIDPDDLGAKTYPNDVVDAFLRRLKNILNHGLWMTKHEGDDYFDVNRRKILKPKVSRTCFTELKISDSMTHAINFGGLGIGFKRFYVINRMGSPVYYVPNTMGSGLHPFFPPFVDEKEVSSIENYSFFKNMSSGHDSNGYISYDLYEESEWRIICSDSILRKITEEKKRYFLDPAEIDDDILQKDIAAAKIKPDYILPVDQWISLIIYPNLQVKNASFKDREIRSILGEIKSEKSKYYTEGIPLNEQINFPVEVDLRIMRNF